MRETACLFAVSLLAACVASASAEPSDVPQAPATESMVRAAYRGVVDLEAHLANPGDTVPLHLGWAQTCDASGACLVEQSTTTTDRATYDERSPLGVATSVSIDFHDGSVAWRGSLALEGATLADGLTVPDAPAAKVGPGPSIVKIGEGLWDVRLPGLDARSFVVEFESFVVTVEAPWSSAAGEQAVDLITGQFPDKPIRYALYSHHHPHASGGLRAFMAAGATVVAPTAHAAYLQEVTGRDFSLAPDRLSKAKGTPTSIALEDTFAIAEAGKSLQVIDIGEQSRHTTHYMMFWLPDAKQLIQGDLGWFVAPDGNVRVGGRSAGLLEAIDGR